MANIIESIFEDILKEVSKAKEVETSLYTMSYHDIGVKAFNAAEIAIKQVKERLSSFSDLTKKRATMTSMVTANSTTVIWVCCRSISTDSPWRCPPPPIWTATARLTTAIWVCCRNC